MDKQVKKDIERRYKKMLEQQSWENTEGQEITFLCPQCGRPTKTKVVDAGIVPMGIECPFCHGDAMQQEEEYPNISVTHEWYRPSVDELVEIAETGLFSAMMILQGGLVRRACE